MVLGLTQPLWERNTRNISWGGKGGLCVGLTTLPPSCAECLEIWEPQTPGTLRARPGLYWYCFNFTFTLLQCANTNMFPLHSLNRCKSKRVCSFVLDLKFHSNVSLSVRCNFSLQCGECNIREAVHEYADRQLGVLCRMLGWQVPHNFS